MANPPHESAAGLIGTTLGTYRIDELLGQGGRGTVYRAYDTRLKRPVALKTIRDDLNQRPDARGRFAREARAAASLNHPGIATILDFDVSGEKAFLVFELLQGCTLREFSRRHRLTIGQVLHFAVQIAEALEAAHACGVIHRDIKPENVMVLERDRIKVLDFGLAKIDPAVSDIDLTTTDATEGLVTAEGTILGTLHYMSPEQLEGRETDERTDLFSFGVVLYELVAGTPPFSGTSAADIIAQVMRCCPEPLRDLNPYLPRDFEAIIAKLLRRDPRQRYSSAAKVRVDLESLRERVTAGELTLDRPAEPEYYLGRTTARLLFLAIQLAYICMYVSAFLHAQALEDGLVFALSGWIPETIVSGAGAGVLVVAMIGLSVRLYLISTVGFDHVRTGVRYRRAFPLFFLMDVLWAFAPLVLIKDYGLWCLPFVPPLVFLPFSQRTLILSAYDTRRPSRTSTGSGSRPGPGDDP